jgi:site-specific DNA recombinase
MDGVYESYIKEEMSARGFGERYKPLEQRLEQIEEEIPRLQGEIDFMKIQLISSNEIFSEAKDRYQRWSDLRKQEKRKIVESITEKITIGKDEVGINLFYLPSSSEMAANSQRHFNPAISSGS